MNTHFPEINNRLGFGIMRLPYKDGDIDMEETRRMIDAYMDAGFNYFDTAHGYLNGRSEEVVKELISSRYPRESFLLTNKLTGEYFKTKDEIRPLFEKQLGICGVDYFDFYLMHSQTATEFAKFEKCHAYEEVLELKREGKIRHFGISFHDRAEVLDEILTKHPEIEIVQIQFNYLDYADPYVDSRRVYETARVHGKELLIMEPVKGGFLSKLTDEAREIFRSLPDYPASGNDLSNAASYALRFAADFEGNRVILSGMSSTEQVQDNIQLFQNLRPLRSDERETITKVTEVLHSLDAVPCTGCRYCVDENHCPKDILIPDLFSCLNSKKIFDDWNMGFYYRSVLTVDHGKASDCIGCKGCERVCPQHLVITELLNEVAKEFE